MIELQHHNYDGFSSEDKAKLNEMARERDAYVHQALFDLHRIQSVYGSARVNKHCKLPNTSHQQIKEEFTNTREYGSGSKYSVGTKLHARPSQCILEPKHTRIINLLKENKLRAIAHQIPHEYQQQQEEQEQEQFLLTNKPHKNQEVKEDNKEKNEVKMQQITDGQVNIDKPNSEHHHQHKHIDNEEKENRLSNGHIVNEHSAEEHLALQLSEKKENNNQNKREGKAVNTQNQINGYSHEDGQMVEYNTKGNKQRKSTSRRDRDDNNDVDCHTNFVIPVHQPLPLSYEVQIMLCEINHQPRPGYLHHVESTLSALFSRAHCVSSEEARKELAFLQPTKHIKENDAFSDNVRGRKVNSQPWWSSSPSYCGQRKLHRKGKLNLHMKVDKDFVPRCATQHTSSYESFMYGRRM